MAFVPAEPEIARRARRPSSFGEPPIPEKCKKLRPRRWAPLVLGGVGTLVVFAFAVTALRNQNRGPRSVQGRRSLAPQIAGIVTPAALSTPLAPLLDSGDLRAKAHSRAVSDPATAALVLRFWLGTSPTESRDVAKG